MTRRLGLMIALALAGACGSDDPIPRPSTVGVVADGCGLLPGIGTGVAVGPDLVVTTAHTVTGADEITVDVDGASVAAEIVAFDKNVDLAVLRVATTLSAAQLEAARTDQRLTLVTWRPDDGLEPSIVEVDRLLRVTIEDIYLDGEHERSAFEFSSPIGQGDSGAPLFDRDGAVVGVVYAKSSARPDVGFAVRSSEIARVLAQVGEPVPDASRC